MLLAMGPTLHCACCESWPAHLTGDVNNYYSDVGLKARYLTYDGQQQSTCLLHHLQRRRRVGYTRPQILPATKKVPDSVPYMVQMDAQSASPFFTLPFELRQNIYTLYLDEDNSFRAHKKSWTTTLHCYPTFLIRPHRTPVPPLVLACKRVFAELSPTVFGEATFVMRERFRRRRKGDSALFAFGKFDPTRWRKLTLIVDVTRDWRFAMDFLRHLVGTNDRDDDVKEGQIPEFGLHGEPKPRVCGAAVALEEFVVRWFPGGNKCPYPTDWALEKCSQKVVEVLAEIKSLRMIRLRDECPAWWVEYLQERSGAIIVFSNWVYEGHPRDGKRVRRRVDTVYHPMVASRG